MVSRWSPNHHLFSLLNTHTHARTHTHTHTRSLTHSHVHTHRFTMVYSETPDMSDPNQEFIQSQQPPHHHQPPARGGGGGAMGGGNPQQHHHGHQQAPMPPQPPPPSNSGFSNSIPPQGGGGGGPHNGRMGMGMGTNRNGNNHINHGMATGYGSVPPGPPEGPQGGLGMEGNYSRSEADHFNHSGPPVQPNFNPPGQQFSTKSLPHSQPHNAYDHQQGARPNFDPRPPYANNHDDMTPLPHHVHQPQYHPPHHPGQSSNVGHARTSTSSRGGFRNFVERPHPYSRPPPSDPPRHNGGWRW